VVKIAKCLDNARRELRRLKGGGREVAGSRRRHLGSRSTWRHWPVERWFDVAPEELTELLATGEQRHAEFKAVGSLSDSAFVARVARAVLAMANRRDGGVVILGVDDTDPMSSSGMSPATVTAWSIFDDVADQFARYADPGVDLTAEQVANGMGTFVILNVAEFSNVPVICKKAFDITGGGSILRKGRSPERHMDRLA
jgi:predicted HTH transcriptional regulator